MTVNAPLNAKLDKPRVLPMAPAPTALVSVAVLEVVVPTTLTVSVQVPPTPVEPPMTPPVMVKTVALAAGLNEPFDAPVPVQLTVAAGVAATFMPAGRLSVNVVSGSVVLFEDGLVSTTVNVLVSPAKIVAGLKDFVPVGGVRPRTDSVALAGVVLVTVAVFSVAW